MVWVEVSNAGGRTLLLDGRTLDVVLVLGCCGLRDGHDTVDAFGSNWTTDRQTGTTVRSDGRSYERFTTIRVTEPPRSGGLCETAIVAAPAPSGSPSDRRSDTAARPTERASAGGASSPDT